MSSRLKDRGGGGGKIMASKPHKTLTEATPKDKKTAAAIATRKAPVAGKENSATSVAANTAIPRRNQLVPSVRWSTSSIPRGKSSNPPDLLPRVSGGRDSGSRVRVSEKNTKSNGPRSSFDANLVKSTGKSGLKLSSEVLHRESGPGIRVLERNTKPRGWRSSLDSNLVKTIGKSDSRTSSEALTRDAESGVKLSQSYQEKKLGKDGNLGGDVNVLEKNTKHNGMRSSFDANVGKVSGKSDSKLSSGAQNRDSGTHIRVSESFQEKKMEKDGNLGNNKPNGLRSSLDANLGKIISEDKAFIIACSKPQVAEEERASDCIKLLENSSKKVAEEKVDQIVTKYPSKLHEKLALLEGRVQRIASDIKRTKEMLDVNNQIESKSILSDIQKKISGIEKAVGCVMSSDGSGNESGPLEIVKKDSYLTANALSSSSCSVKGLNLVELEARFFPHQKLLKNRTSLNDSMCPVDENPIAVEFLASLGTKSELTGLQAMVAESASSVAICAPSKVETLQCDEEVSMMASEKFEDFDDIENKQKMMVFEEAEDSSKDQIFEIGRKCSTGGWFVSEGEAVLIAHSDGSCSYYDIGNCEEKAEYKPLEGVSNNMWSDCWLIRAPGADGCSGRYVVAASAGNTLESGFCSWDFYTKNIQAYLVENGTSSSTPVSSSRTALAPLTNIGLYRRSASCLIPTVETRQFWYRPCGPLLISTASRQKSISAYDIRDGDLVMKWDVSSPVVGMEYSSPIQWRSKGKVIVAETETISLWDVNSLNPQPLLSVASSGKKISCLHVNNTDAEIGGGVRQRMRSSELEGNDGVFCTQDSIHVFDFRLPSGVGLKISGQELNAHSTFSSGDSIFVGTTETRLSLRNSSCSRVQQFSLRKGKISATYVLPDSNSHGHYASITQVWGNSNFVMGICGMGLFVFDALKEEPMQILSTDRAIMEVKERIGPDDLYCPTFDYSSSRALVISRDRPAMWRYL